MNKSRYLISIFSLFFVICHNSQAYDPMAPPGYEATFTDGQKNIKRAAHKSERANYVLRQIVHRGEKRSAVINGYVVNEGSYLKNAYVKSIGKNSVVLSISGRDKTLKLEASLPRVRR